MMIGFTLDNGTYSRSGNNMDLAKIKNVNRPPSQGLSYQKQKREPGICISWEEKKRELPEIIEREEIAEKTWKEVDSLGYNFCWTNLIW